MKNDLQIINQLFEIQSRLKDKGEYDSFERNFNRLFGIFEESGLMVQDPTGEPYSGHRTDCEASISGKLSLPMKITKTIKPIIYQKAENNLQLIQKAVVLVENN